MPNLEDLDDETRRRREIVLEFINRKPEKPKEEVKIEEVVAVPIVEKAEINEQPETEAIKEEISNTEAIEEIKTEAVKTSPVLLLNAPDVAKMLPVTKIKTSCEFKPIKKPIEVKTGVQVEQKKYDGPLICIVPKKNRTPKKPAKSVKKKSHLVVEKKHHGSRRERGGVVREFLRTLGDMLN